MKWALSTAGGCAAQKVPCILHAAGNFCFTTFEGHEAKELDKQGIGRQITPSSTAAGGVVWRFVSSLLCTAARTVFGSGAPLTLLVLEARFEKIFEKR